MSTTPLKTMLMATLVTASLIGIPAAVQAEPCGEQPAVTLTLAGGGGHGTGYDGLLPQPAEQEQVVLARSTSTWAIYQLDGALAKQPGGNSNGGFDG